MKIFKSILMLLLIAGFVKAYEIGPSNYNSAINSNKYVVVKFWAPWCNICRVLEPEYKKAKRALNGQVLFLEYNYDKGSEFAQGLNIIGLPTMILYKNGKEVSRYMADATKDEIIEWINSNK